MEDFDILDYSTDKLPKMTNGYELTPEFEKAYRAIENTNDCIFLTGNAGSGKTTFLKYWLSHTKKKTVVLAPTGMAAINLSSGKIKASTIHKFFRFRPVPLTDANVPRLSEEEIHGKGKIYMGIDTIVIDECSMVSSMMLQAIDTFYRINYDTDEPFGGKQIIFVGDLAQLPPVIPTDAERMYIEYNFKSRYFFDAEVLKRCGFKMISFTKIFRQKDEEFVYYLNKIRTGSLSQTELNDLNKRLYGQKIDDEYSVTLCTVNKIVEDMNRIRLSQIDSLPINYTGQVEGNFNFKNCCVDQHITVKKGAKVMIRINHSEGEYVNGTIGIFEDEGSNGGACIKVKDRYFNVEPYNFEQSNFYFDARSKEIKSSCQASMKQVPISIAYAMSIHKSQGSTFENMKINLDGGCFESGQAYVALSRGTSLNGISLLTPISIKDIFVDPIILDFYRRMEESGNYL